MNLNPPDVLNPVFNALDALIADYGVYPRWRLAWHRRGLFAVVASLWTVRGLSTVNAARRLA